MTETAGQIDIFEVLAAAEADEQNSRIDRHGIPVLFASPTGWPVITRRGDTIALRSVPHRSPWGGYDVAAATAEAHLARRH